MSENGARNVSHIVGSREVSATNCRQGLRTQQQCDGGSWAGAIVSRRMIPCASYHIDDVTLHAGLDMHGTHFCTTAGDGVGFTERLNVDLIKAARIEARVPTRDHL